MIQTIFFFQNGVVAVFDEHGEQMPEYQQLWTRVYIQWIEQQDGHVAPDVQIRLPDGKYQEHGR